MQSLMKEFEKMMETEGFDDAFTGFMDQMTKKEFLYEPLKELSEKYTIWLAAKKNEISDSDTTRYEGQLHVINEIVHMYDSVTDKPTAEESAQIMDLLNKVHFSITLEPECVTRSLMSL